jgi:hypothetical protein
MINTTVEKLERAFFDISTRTFVEKTEAQSQAATFLD